MNLVIYSDLNTFVSIYLKRILYSNQQRCIVFYFYLMETGRLFCFLFRLALSLRDCISDPLGVLLGKVPYFYKYLNSRGWRGRSAAVVHQKGRPFAATAEIK
jgi:hypothetical protein